MTRHGYYKPRWKRVGGDPTMSGDLAKFVGVILAVSIVLTPFYYCARAMFGVYGLAWGIVGWGAAALFFAAVCGLIVVVGEAADPASIEVDEQDAERVEKGDDLDASDDDWVFRRGAVAERMNRRRPPV